MIFLETELKEIKIKNPDISGLEARKVAAKIWTQIKDTEKGEIYYTRSEEEKKKILSRNEDVIMKKE